MNKNEIRQESKHRPANTRSTIGGNAGCKQLLKCLPRKRINPRKPREKAYVREEFQIALRECGRGLKPWPLTLSGPAGTGKTCAALWLFDWVPDVDLFTPNTFLTLEQLAEEYSAAMFGTLRNNLHRESPIISDLEFWRRWKRMTLAGIDDIGERQNVTDHRYQTLKRAIDEREGNALIITTNLSIEDIAVKTDDRIASRLAGGTFVRIDGDDMRLQETF